MAVAVNALGKQGGIVVVRDKKVIAELELAIGGIMSNESISDVVKKHNNIVEMARQLSPSGSNETLMILGFISLLVIPHFKLGDKGIFDVGKFEYVK